MNNKPIFHITGEKGWINDPNGVVKYKGQYHVFYQHHPYSCEWGPMHWGHVVSDDLMHWKYLPYALVPGDSFDKDGCFSGTSLVVGNTLYIVTGQLLLVKIYQKNTNLVILEILNSFIKMATTIY